MPEAAFWERYHYFPTSLNLSLSLLNLKLVNCTLTLKALRLFSVDITNSIINFLS